MINLTTSVFQDQDFKSGIMKLMNNPGLHPKGHYTLKRIMDKLRQLQPEIATRHKEIEKTFFKIETVKNEAGEDVQQRVCTNKEEANAALEELYSKPIEIPLSQISAPDIMYATFLTGSELDAIEPILCDIHLLVAEETEGPANEPA